LRRDHAGRDKPQSCQHPDQGGERAKRRTWFHRRRVSVARLELSTREPDVLLPLMTVEEADLPLGLGHESGHERHDNEKLN
jgi:hypothetical protein